MLKCVSYFPSQFFLVPLFRGGFASRRHEDAPRMLVLISQSNYRGAFRLQACFAPSADARFVRA